MKPISHEQLLEALNWRYATKIFDPAKKIPAPVWDALVQTLVLTPTSFGLQPYKFLVVQDPTKRAQLLPHSFNNKSQTVDSSHLVVFATRTEIKETDADRLINRVAEVRQIPAEKLAGYRQMIVERVVHGKPGDGTFQWAARQTYIALGNLMTAAAVLGVDTCAVEGLEPESYDKILGLEGSGYKTLVALALGYRSAGDKYAVLAKVRFETKDVVHVI